MKRISLFARQCIKIVSSQADDYRRTLPSDSGRLRFVRDDFTYEFLDGLQHRLGLVAMRRVAAIGQSENFYRAGGLTLDGFDLRHGAVLIVEPLDDKDGTGDVG